MHRIQDYGSWVEDFKYFVLDFLSKRRTLLELCLSYIQ